MGEERGQQAAEHLKTSLLDALEELFDAFSEEPQTPEGAALSERRVRLATAVLILEIMRADFETKDDERRAMRDTLRRVFGLTAEETAELARHAQVQADRPPRLHEYAAYVDRRCTPEQKRQIVKALWQVAFADAEILVHEEYLVRKISELLHVSRADFIAAKIEAREEFR